MNKYGAKRVGAYDSKKEARRAQELALLQQAGLIAGLEHHPVFSIDVAGIHICRYEADFRYQDKESGRVIIEDVKGMRTEIYKLKKKLVLAVHGLEILET